MLIVSVRKVLVKMTNKKKAIIIILSVIFIAAIVTLGLNIYKAKKLADMEDRIIQLRLEQNEIEFELELQDIPNNERLSDIENLNILFEPTEETYEILKRWEIVHHIDPDYPYPATEIEEQDWMGLNYFLYGDLDDEEGAAKAEMNYDENNNIDSDVLDYIMSDIESNHPVVEEAIKQMNSEE